jgi:hypothetical protein
MFDTSPLNKLLREAQDRAALTGVKPSDTLYDWIPAEPPIGVDMVDAARYAFHGLRSAKAMEMDSACKAAVNKALDEFRAEFYKPPPIIPKFVDPVTRKPITKVEGGCIEYRDKAELDAILEAEKAKLPLRERLARELFLAPDASEDLVYGTVVKRLAGDWEDLKQTERLLESLRDRKRFAQQKLEQALDEIHTVRRENDELRAEVAEARLAVRRKR